MPEQSTPQVTVSQEDCRESGSVHCQERLPAAVSGPGRLSSKEADASTSRSLELSGVCNPGSLWLEISPVRGLIPELKGKERYSVRGFPCLEMSVFKDCWAQVPTARRNHDF